MGLRESCWENLLMNKMRLGVTAGLKAGPIYAARLNSCIGFADNFKYD